MSSYTDIKNNTYKIIEYSLVSGEEQEQARRNAVEELYNILMRK